MHFNFLKYYKIFYIFSGILILLSLFCLGVFRLNFGIEFTGGSILEVEYKEARPSNQAIRDAFAGFNLGSIYVQPTGQKGAILRFQSTDEETHQRIVQKLKEGQDLEEQRFDSIGPTIGQELKQKTNIIIALAFSALVLYIAFAFRRVQRPLNSWQYGVVALIALFHDILIPLGAFSILGRFYGVQISIPVVVALLTVLGYSINNVVVVFDRVRENLLRKKGASFEETVNESLNETLVRCINTSLTTLFPLIAIFFLGGETLKFFALALIFGITAGTYSSLCLAGPLLVSWLSRRRREGKVRFSLAGRR